MMEALFGCGLLLAIGTLVVVLFVNSEKKRKEERKQFDHQMKIFDGWAKERFGPSETDKIGMMRPLSPYEWGLDPEEKKRRMYMLRNLPSRWAEKMIDTDKRDRRRQSEHFTSWGSEKFDDSWPETLDKLCLLVSSNRTRSIDKLSDAEIEVLNGYVLAETLGGVSSSSDAVVKIDRTTGGTRWIQSKCQNCGAPLLKGNCIYCSTNYQPQ